MNEFKSDWNELEACRDSLREHMALAHRYKKALHDAIKLPKGVVPHSAEGLYDHRYYETK